MGVEEDKIKREDAYFDKLVADTAFSHDNAFGMAATYNKEIAIEDYKTKIRKSKAWTKKHRHLGKQGFSQFGVN
jgi:hypothetical protein